MDKKRVRILSHCLAWLLCGMLLAAMMLPDAGARGIPAAASEGALAGRIIAVDAGHGGYDGGARAPGGTWEKVYNLNIATRLKDYLTGLGAKVVMTREGDYALCDPNPKMRKKRQDMERRADVVLLGQAELLVSVHMNEYRDRSQSGPQVFFRADCAAGRQLANTLQKSLVSALVPRKARTALPGDFYIISLGIPSALVECGFLSNAAEEALLRTDEYAQRVAEAIGDGIAEWLTIENRPEAAARQDR